MTPDIDSPPQSLLWHPWALKTRAMPLSQNVLCTGQLVEVCMKNADGWVPEMMN